ncbi:LamG-like jellyroll fold domain-containing protein [Streptomyces radicis]|uniref:DNRLRE domain-containing protein n=1 Tax=Streptomyces radicis TaxID=1750517 RepID=A0A3A9WFY2_9ACTN|nr:LamG-like jellyroll fold domain-containing protein [Streptomyces radicis]RKN12141.1 DNRLRE domain-containing protein [Streptomyces radicis]RKN25806.1 DNRLRE domain-containing protein [Streptomyces radicis]
MSTGSGRARRAWRVRGGALGAVLALTAGLLAGTGGPSAPQARALTPPLTMTADDLPTWQTNGIVYALAEANGVVYVGGTFSTVRPPGAASGTQEVPAANFVALDAATGAPVDCDLSFTVGSGTATVRSLAVSPDGQTLYAGGTFGSVNGVGASSVAAFDLGEGCARLPFPVAANGIVRAIEASDERVYLGGDFTQLNGTARARFGAVDTAGAVQGWRADGDEIGKAIALTPDGEHVILGGDFFEINGADSHALAVVDADTGANVRTYPLPFIESRSTVQDLVVDANGFYTANEGTGGFDGRIALDLETFDQKWRDTCLGATQAVAVHDEVLYSGHHAHDCSSMGAFPNQARYHLLAQSVHDPELLGWFPNTNDGLGEQLGPRVMTVAGEHPTDDREFMWVGGGFTTVNGQPQWGLTRFATGPDTGAPTVPEAHAASPAADRVDVTWAPSLDLDDSLLTYRVYRNGGSQPVHTVEGSSLPWRKPQLTWSDPDVAAGETHSYRLTATDGAGNTSALSPPVSVTVASGGQPYADAVLADDPVIFWNYDETAGNFASDASGNGGNGIHRGGPQRGTTPPAVPGPAAAAVGYDGTDSYTYSDRAYAGMTRYTVETWFNTTTTRGGKLIGMGDRILELSSRRDHNVYMLNDGRLTFGVYTNTYRTITSAQSFNDGEWHHVAASVGANGMRLYVDGEQVAANGVVTAARSVSGYWRTGGDSLSGWPNRPASDYFAGRQDATAIYPAQLSAARVAAHHDAASIPTDTVTALAPTADTYVNGAAVNANHGTHQQLAVRGTPAYESYLAFDLPEAPPGQVLKAAALRVRVSNDAAAGSLDDFSVRPITGAWTETGTTYATRPALGAEVLGTLSAPAALGGAHSVPLDLGTVEGALGGTFDVALTGTGTDSLWLWADEAAAAGNRPQLLLTFGAP